MFLGHRKYKNLYLVNSINFVMEKLRIPQTIDKDREINTIAGGT
jgi:hypothetical protein